MPYYKVFIITKIYKFLSPFKKNKQITFKQFSKTMSKTNKNSAIEKGQQFDIILSQQDYYEKVTKTKQLYEQSLLKNKQLQQKLQAQKQSTKTLKNETQQLIKKVFIMAQKIILFEQENCRLLQQLQKTNKKLKAIKSAQSQKIQTYKQSIQKLSNQLSQYKEKQIRLVKKNEKFIAQIDGLKRKVESSDKGCENIQVQNQRLDKENMKLKLQHEQITMFTDVIIEKITKIHSLLELKEMSNESMIQMSCIQSVQIKKQQQQEQKISQNTTKVKDQTKTQQISQQSIKTKENDKLNLSFIECTLNQIIQKMQSDKVSFNEINQLKQLNKSLQTTNQSLTKRLAASQARCQHLEHQLSSELNIRKVIQTKYMGIRQVINNNQQVDKAMQDIIKKYHQAIDNQYAKIIQKMINQQ